MITRIRRNLIDGGLAPAEDDLDGQELLARVRLAGLLAFGGLVLILLAGALCPRPLSPAAAVFSPAVAALFVLVLVLLRLTRDVRWSGFLLLAIWMGLTAFGKITGGFAGAGLLYAMPVPLFVLFLHGRRTGGLLLALFATLDALLSGAAILGLLPCPFRPGPLLVAFLTFLLLSLLAWLHEDRETAMAERMHRRIYYDPLTGLPNRTMLMRDLPRMGSPLLMLIGRGRLQGDQRRVWLPDGGRGAGLPGPAAGAPPARLRPPGLPAGGDEFAILADGAEQPLTHRETENAAKLLAEFIHGERLVSERHQDRPPRQHGDRRLRGGRVRRGSSPGRTSP